MFFSCGQFRLQYDHVFALFYKERGISMEVIPQGNTSVITDSSGSRDRDWPERTTERVKDALTEALAQIMSQFTDTQVSVVAQGQAGQLATEKIGAAAVLDTEKVGAANQLANSLAFSNTQNQLITGFKDGRFDAATLTASILQSQVGGFKDALLFAAQNTAAIQSALAECCCEIQRLVISDGDKTRDRMDAIDARNRAVDLVDAKNEVTLLKLQLAAKVSSTPVVS
jgi:hypothetical protein